MLVTWPEEKSIQNVRGAGDGGNDMHGQCMTVALTVSAQSRSSRLWLADIQMRARADRRGVAGKPTTTMAMPRSNSSRDVEEILPGLNSITGCTSTIAPHFLVYKCIETEQAARQL